MVKYLRWRLIEEIVGRLVRANPFSDKWCGWAASSYTLLPGYSHLTAACCSVPLWRTGTLSALQCASDSPANGDNLFIRF